MRILLTNDDGINAPGILQMMDTFSSDHEIIVVAPEGERSGHSHSVTIFRNMRFFKAEHKVKEAYALEGSPADCVKFAVIHLFKDNLPDLVLSGINSGPNMGSDIMYSGTVAAATEAVHLGIPAIALSLATWVEGDNNLYKDAAEFLKRNLDSLYKTAKAHVGEVVLNINYPHKPFLGAKWVKAGINWYDDFYEECKKTGMVQLKGIPAPHLKMKKIAMLHL